MKMKNADQLVEIPNKEISIAPLLAPLRAGRTLRFGIRAAWEAIGFLCAASLTLFAALAIPLSILAAHGRANIAAVAASAVLYLLIVPPLYAGVCWLAHKVFERDEPSYVDIWRGFRLVYWRSVGLGTLQAFGAAILVANIFFYAGRGSAPFLLLAVLFGYAALFWAMNCFYHWPLLVAGEARIVKREGGGPPALASVLRNGFLLAMSAPMFTFLLTASLFAVTAVFALSGVGLALLGAGFAAFLTTQAARDQLVRFGALPPQPDPDEPLSEERWRVEGPGMRDEG